jgi:hypothetical protein
MVRYEFNFVPASRMISPMSRTPLQEAPALAALFPRMPPQHEAEAMRHYRAIFGGLGLDDWERQGTVLTRRVNGRKINFAARRNHCTVGFCGHAVIEFYRFIGGECPSGEVTIKTPYYREWRFGRISQAIEWYLNNG